VKIIFIDSPMVFAPQRTRQGCRGLRKTKAKKKAAMDAKKNALRAEDITKGVFVSVNHLPKKELKRATDLLMAADQ